MRGIVCPWTRCARNPQSILNTGALNVGAVYLEKSRVVMADIDVNVWLSQWANATRIIGLILITIISFLNIYRVRNNYPLCRPPINFLNKHKQGRPPQHNHVERNTLLDHCQKDVFCGSWHPTGLLLFSFPFGAHISQCFVGYTLLDVIVRVVCSCLFTNARCLHHSRCAGNNTEGAVHWVARNEHSVVRRVYTMSALRGTNARRQPKHIYKRVNVSRDTRWMGDGGESRSVHASRSVAVKVHAILAMRLLSQRIWCAI